MRTLGYGQAFIDPAGNAVGIIGGGPRQVVLLGHIDTVPGQIPMRVEAGVLYGRGSVDAKGPLAAFVDAAARRGEVEGWQWVVIGAVEEERDSEGARAIVEQYHPDYVVIGEPSGWKRLTLGYKGSAWVEVRVRQALAHSAGGSRSACEAAFEIWKDVQEWTDGYNADQERNFDKALPALRGFDSGGDGFQEWACLRIGMRLPPGLTPKDWYTQLSQIAGATAGVEVKRSGFAMPAYQGEKNNPLVRAFLSSMRASQGKPGFLLKSGTSDMNIVAPVWGCPAAAYGPGDSSLDHTPEEHLELHEYEQAVEVLEGVLGELSKGK
jgi:LysW-gamma-L-lysine carboxypeptidase